MSDELDGCELDFTADPLPDSEREALLIPEGSEVDEHEPDDASG